MPLYLHLAHFTVFSILHKLRVADGVLCFFSPIELAKQGKERDGKDTP